MKRPTEQKTIVVSAVNLNIGGTLTILRDCLSYLSALAPENYRIIAIVYKKELAYYPNIEYIETQWPKKRWINRLWYEYVSMKNISEQIGPVYLWFSLHDTTPNVVAEHRAVYCHNAFPFYKWKWREWIFAPKIVLFALLTKYIYKTNIHRNTYLVVQQQWFREEFVRMFGLRREKIIVSPPTARQSDQKSKNSSTDTGGYTFIYAASPNSHKNFECLAEATKILSDRGVGDFRVYITVKGNENAYARWLYRKWGDVPQLDFRGFMDRETLFNQYTDSDCLVFPSKVETWGLPITEFGAFDKSMLLADLPYAHETASGYGKVAFFDPDRPDELAQIMSELIDGEEEFLKPVPKKQIEDPVSHNWEELFDVLLKKIND